MSTCSIKSSFQACSNNLGKCTSGSCVGTKYRDRRNECGGLNCCETSSTTTHKSVDQETTTQRSSVLKTTPKSEDSNEGKVISLHESS